MKIKNIEFKSTNDTNTIKAIIYVPTSNPIKGIVQITHGMREHMGRYEEFAKFLCNNGYIVCGHDHAGHGKSVDSDYMLGFFAHKRGWEVLVDDTYKFTRIVKKLYPDLPYYLFGHSMGSFIARLYASYYTYDINGLILSGTGGKNNMTKMAIGLCNATIMAKGEMYRSNNIDKITFGSYNEKCGEIITGKEWLSRDYNIAHIYLKDPKCNFIFTASAFKDLFTLHSKANDSVTFKNTSKDLPIFIFSGDEDPVGKYGRGVTQVYQNYRGTGIRDITIKLYNGGRHEMLNETNKCEVYADVLNWLDTHEIIEIGYENKAK